MLCHYSPSLNVDGSPNVQVRYRVCCGRDELWEETAPPARRVCCWRWPHVQPLSPVRYVARTKGYWYVHWYGRPLYDVQYVPPRSSFQKSRPQYVTGTRYGMSSSMIHQRYNCLLLAQKTVLAGTASFSKPIAKQTNVC